MISVRGGRLNVWSELREVRVRAETTEATITTVPAGTPTGAAVAAGRRFDEAVPKFLVVIQEDPRFTPVSVPCRRLRSL
jgi:hypothetical protein